MLDRYQAIDPDMLALTAESTVLDVGCGTGRHILELSRLPGTFIGLDMAREDLRQMRSLLDATSPAPGGLATVHHLQGARDRPSSAAPFLRDLPRPAPSSRVPRPAIPSD